MEALELARSFKIPRKGSKAETPRDHNSPSNGFMPGPSAAGSSSESRGGCGGNAQPVTPRLPPAPPRPMRTPKGMGAEEKQTLKRKSDHPSTPHHGHRSHHHGRKEQTPGGSTRPAADAAATTPRPPPPKQRRSAGGADRPSGSKAVADAVVDRIFGEIEFKEAEEQKRRAEAEREHSPVLNHSLQWQRASPSEEEHREKPRALTRDLLTKLKADDGMVKDFLNRETLMERLLGHKMMTGRLDSFMMMGFEKMRQSMEPRYSQSDMDLPPMDDPPGPPPVRVLSPGGTLLSDPCSSRHPISFMLSTRRGDSPAPPPPPPPPPAPKMRGPKTPPGSPTMEEKRAMKAAAAAAKKEKKEKEGLNIDRELGPDLSRALDKCGNKKAVLETIKNALKGVGGEDAPSGSMMDLSDNDDGFSNRRSAGLSSEDGPIGMVMASDDEVLDDFRGLSGDERAEEDYDEMERRVKCEEDEGSPPPPPPPPPPEDDEDEKYRPPPPPPPLPSMGGASHSHLQQEQLYGMGQSMHGAAAAQMMLPPPHMHPSQYLECLSSLQSSSSSLPHHLPPPFHHLPPPPPPSMSMPPPPMTSGYSIPPPMSQQQQAMQLQLGAHAAAATQHPFNGQSPAFGGDWCPPPPPPSSDSLLASSNGGSNVVALSSVAFAHAPPGTVLASSYGGPSSQQLQQLQQQQQAAAAAAASVPLPASPAKPQQHVNVNKTLFAALGLGGGACFGVPPPPQPTTAPSIAPPAAPGELPVLYDRYGQPLPVPEKQRQPPPAAVAAANGSPSPFLPQYRSSPAPLYKKYK